MLSKVTNVLISGAAGFALERHHVRAVRDTESRGARPSR